MKPAEEPVWVKLERANPDSSILDLIALSLIDDAGKKGNLKPHSVIVEPTYSKTGVGLAMVAAVKGSALQLQNYASGSSSDYAWQEALRLNRSTKTNNTLRIRRLNIN